MVCPYFHQRNVGRSATVTNTNSNYDMLQVYPQSRSASVWTAVCKKGKEIPATAVAFGVPIALLPPPSASSGISRKAKHARPEPQLEHGCKCHSCLETGLSHAPLGIMAPVSPPLCILSCLSRTTNALNMNTEMLD